MIDNIESSIANAKIICRTPQLPIWGLPDNVQRIIENYTNGLQANRDIVTAAVLCAISTAAGKRKRIKFDNFTNTPCVWFCVVAPSGSNKSTPIKEMLQPLNDIDTSEYNTWKNGDKQQPYNQIIISDTTPEARNKVLQYSNGLLLYSDELATFYGHINRYNKKSSGGELAHLLSIYDNSDFTINRIGDETTRIQAPFMNIIGTTQPRVFAQIFADNTDNGFLHRFLFVYLPNERAQYHSDTIISDEIKKEWDRYIQRIYQDKTDTILHCDDAARGRLIDYENKLTDSINNADANNDYLRTYLGKSKKTLERLTLISAIANNAPAITLQHVNYAIECVEYFINSAQNVRNLLQQPKQTDKKTNNEIIQSFFELFPNANKMAVSQACGMSDYYISRMLNYKKNN
ncbi:MAG: DUF3987 domain-containing protein [Paludibacteraceae bacterium]